MMKNKTGFFISFAIVVLLHIYVLNSYKVEQQAHPFILSVKKFSTVINLQQGSIKETEPTAEPVTEEVRPEPEAITEKVLPEPVKNEETKKNIVKKKKKRKRVSKRRFGGQVSGPRQKVYRENYFSKVRRIIEQRKRYPYASIKLREEGTVHIEFRVSRDGTIRHIRLVKKSPYARLNHAAMKILKEIGSFPPIPKEVGKSSLFLTVAIKYKISK